MNAVLPQGYTARAARMEDVEAVVSTLNAYSRSQTGADHDSVEGMRLLWQSPGFELSTDSLVIFDGQGQVAGYSDFKDWGGPHARLVGWSAVHPDHQGRGLGKYILGWLVERGQKQVAKAPPDARVVLQVYALTTNRAATNLFTRCGFQYVRSMYVMRIEFDQPPQPPAPGAEITIRPIDGSEEETRAALLAAHTAFQDHYGNTNQPFDEYYRRVVHHIENDPHYDPSVWFIALDGSPDGSPARGQIVGVSLCSMHMDEDPALGWVDTLGVLRPWRKRGIGLALLQRSFAEFYRLGKKRAGLNVDASSLTGAVRLYEQAGMHIMRQSDTYELELRPGKDLMRKALD